MQSFYTDHMLAKLVGSLAVSNGVSGGRLSSGTAALLGAPKKTL